MQKNVYGTGVGDKIISYLHDSPSMKEKSVSTWEEHLEGILIEFKRDIEKENSMQTSDKLFNLYTVCRYVLWFLLNFIATGNFYNLKFLTSKKMALWHKHMQKEMWHWVPKNEDPLDTKWSQKRVIPKLGHELQQLYKTIFYRSFRKVVVTLSRIVATTFLNERYIFGKWNIFSCLSFWVIHLTDIDKDTEDGFDGWFYRNGVPLKSSIPAYFIKT